MSRTAIQLVATNKLILGRETRVRKLIGGVMREVDSNARIVIEAGTVFDVPAGRRQMRDEFGEAVVSKDGTPKFETYDMTDELLKKGARRLEGDEVPAVTKGPKKPAGKALVPAIVSAMYDLADDAEAQTSDGKASVPALEKALGYDITAADRDNAHEVYLTELDAKTGPESGADSGDGSDDPDESSGGDNDGPDGKSGKQPGLG